MSYCKKCGNKISEDVSFCPNCGNKTAIYVTEKQQSPGNGKAVPDTTDANKSEESLVVHDIRDLNWFQRHLNWASLLAVLVSYPLAFLSGFIFSGLGTDSVYGLAIVINLLWLFITHGCILRQKNRSLFFLLVLVIPLGWIIFLALENKNP